MEIERAGGAWAALEAGLIQRNVATVRAQRMHAVAEGAEALIGTNAFPDLHEVPATVLDVPCVTVAADGVVAVKAERLPRIRLAGPFEALRDASDRMLAETGARPKIFLATLGAAAEVTEGATFATNFFAAGGIEAVDPGEVADRDALVAAFERSRARLACLCGPGAASAGEVARALRAAGATHIYVRGREGERGPASADAPSLIYAGCDMLAILERAHEMLGLAR
jgi:methylmalonyl-CoA mutase